MIPNMLRNMVSARTEDLLCALGLQQRQSVVDRVFTATTYFIAGAIVGSCVALLLAPTSGQALRERIAERVRAASERARQAASEVRGRVARRGPSGDYDDASVTAS